MDGIRSCDGCGKKFNIYNSGYVDDRYWCSKGCRERANAGKRRTEEEAEASRRSAWESRECPECAETVKKKAKVCRHCGYKFEDRDAVVAEMERVEAEAQEMGCEPWWVMKRKADLQKLKEMQERGKKRQAQEWGCSVEDVPRIEKERKHLKWMLSGSFSDATEIAAAVKEYGGWKKVKFDAN